VNVAGATIGDYVRVIERLTPLDAIAAFEINGPARNQRGGLEFGRSLVASRVGARLPARLLAPPQRQTLTGAADLPSMARVARARARGGDAREHGAGMLAGRLGNGTVD